MSAFFEQRSLDFVSQTGWRLPTQMATEVIDALRARIVLGTAGATIGNLMTGRPGQVALPRISSVETVSLGCGGAPTSTAPSLDQVLFTPHSCALSWT